jgi:predicted signal transduction protein with EAL and GGDEF domain
MVLATSAAASAVPDFTVSVGLASADTGEALSEVIDRADAALLQAKQLGRDRVVIAGELVETAPSALAPTTVANPSARPAAHVAPISGAR